MIASLRPQGYVAQVEMAPQMEMALKMALKMAPQMALQMPKDR